MHVCIDQIDSLSGNQDVKRGQVPMGIQICLGLRMYPWATHFLIKQPQYKNGHPVEAHKGPQYVNTIDKLARIIDPVKSSWFTTYVIITLSRTLNPQISYPRRVPVELLHRSGSPLVSPPATFD